MERIYCDCYNKWNSGIQVGDDAKKYTSVECTYRMIGSGCIFSDDDIKMMEKERVFCPFWDTDEAWIIIEYED